MITKLETWKTSDGKIHFSEIEAFKHENNILEKFKEGGFEIIAWAQRYDVAVRKGYSDTYDNGVRASHADIIDILTRHKLWV